MNLFMRVQTVVRQALVKIFRGQSKTYEDRPLAHYHPFMFGKL